MHRALYMRLAAIVVLLRYMLPSCISYLPEGIPERSNAVSMVTNLPASLGPMLFPFRGFVPEVFLQNRNKI